MNKQIIDKTKYDMCFRLEDTAIMLEHKRLKVTSTNEWGFISLGKVRFSNQEWFYFTGNGYASYLKKGTLITK